MVRIHAPIEQVIEVLRVDEALQNPAFISAHKDFNCRAGQIAVHLLVKGHFRRASPKMLSIMRNGTVVAFPA